MLTLKNIKKIYDNGNIALNNINLNFRKNEFVTILGPSGSGKTTLLNIIGGLDRYTTGDIIINGMSTKYFKDRNWDSYRNSCIGFIFQDYNLIKHLSVYKNVEMSLTLSGVKNKKDMVVETLKKVGLEKHIHKKPSELSGGQIQRVAIARALVNNPEIILADEPTGALDSQTSTEVMKIIKEISKDKLVIMVSHNEKLAYRYSSRIINIKDGVIINDSNPLNENKSNKKFKIKKTKMSFLTALSLSLNNIKTKKARTFLTSIASSIGIIGIAVILSISNGFKKQIDNYEAGALTSFPITITSSSFLENGSVLEKEDNLSTYPSNNILYSYNYSNNETIHKNKIDNNYISYIEKISNKYINTIFYDRIINLNILTFNGVLYKELNNKLVNLIELPQQSYLKENYDLLKGDYPSKPEDVVLIVDNKNRVDINLLKALFCNSLEKINFDEIIGQEFKLVKNDDFYKRVDDNVYVKNDVNKELYEMKSNKTLRIVGILRRKKGNNILETNTSSNDISKIGYTNELVKQIIKDNKNSNIVNSQINSSGIVFMGKIEFDRAGITKQEALTMLGENDIPSAIYIYPKDFKSKDKIINYLDRYNKNKPKDEKIIYSDYAKEIINLSKKIMDAITIVLIVFSSISLIVSSIMIGIITYISVIERTREIGILRSLGARKKDISRVFNMEVLIVGLSTGIIGIVIAKLMIIFINLILYKLTDLKDIAMLDLKHAFILIIISTLLTLLGGFIPAKKASKKNPVEALKS